MNNPFPYLPGIFQKIIASLKFRKAPAWLIFFILGFLATIWFLIRVVPKPSRAQYPCMRICAPFMSGFVIQLLALIGSVFSYRLFRLYFSRLSYLPGIFVSDCGCHYLADSILGTLTHSSGRQYTKDFLLLSAKRSHRDSNRYFPGKGCLGLGFHRHQLFLCQYCQS